ncbi:MAG: hypothetical protein IPL49_00865 [Saprospirales bacterium]|nr:hypothetical protein [Saprospirales bacterium]
MDPSEWEGDAGAPYHPSTSQNKAASSSIPRRPEHLFDGPLYLLLLLLYGHTYTPPAFHIYLT